jgi:putative copper export protein
MLLASGAFHTRSEGLMDHTRHQQHSSRQHSHYGRLLIMVAISFVAMYALMYAMVDRLGNVHNDVNQVYMAGLMAAIMLPIELLVMRSVYYGSSAAASSRASSGRSRR